MSRTALPDPPFAGTKTEPGTTGRNVTCEPWQVAISAQLDGEDPGVEPRLLQAHLATCAECTRFQAISEATLRKARIQPAQEMPDLSRPLVKLNAIADRAASWSIVRVLLAVVAFDVLFFALKALILADEADATAHAARHLGAFSFAYGVGLLVVVVRPARARTMLPVAAVLAGALFITAVIDLSNGTVPLTGEATHLPELISVLLIWMLAVPSHKREKPAARPGSSTGSRPLRALPTIDDQAV
jgi:predicted anti-sigma-YlaC factor YlaD